MCSNNSNNSFIEVSMYLVLTNNWGQAHVGFLSLCYLFNQEAKV